MLFSCQVVSDCSQLEKKGCSKPGFLVPHHHPSTDRCLVTEGACIAMKLQAMPSMATHDGQVIVEISEKT